MIESMLKYTLACIIYLLICGHSVAQNGYNIEINLRNYPSDKLVIAHEFLNRFPVMDTLEQISPGNFAFEGDDSLDAGVYLAVLLPENEFVSFIVDTDDQHFKLEADAAALFAPIVFKESKYNNVYQDYLTYSNKVVASLTGLNERLRENIDDKVRADLKKSFSQKLASLESNRTTQINKAPNSLAAELIRMKIETPIPDMEGSEQKVMQKKYKFRQDHYFDNVDLSDERLLNTEALFDKVFFYLNELTPQNIQSINGNIDYVLSLMKPGTKNFKFYLDHIMLEYASSDFIGMDAVYVHVVDNYYAKGMAPWVKKEDLDEMLEDVRKRKPILMGSPAPKIDMELKDGTPIALYDVDAPITILYLWQPSCSHCKASMPYMKSFWEKYKSTGVKIFSGCTKVGAKTADCWDYIEENGLGEWINTVDKDLSSRFVQKYMAEKTPKLFILDANKNIILKDFDASQLEEIMPSLFETDRLEKLGGVIKSK